MRLVTGFVGVCALLAFSWFAYHQVPIYLASLDAHKEAQRRIDIMIEEPGRTRLDLSDLDALRAVPHDIRKVEQLEWLLLNNTNVTDLRPLIGLQKLARLELGQTPVTDLAPLSELKMLRYLNLHRSWAFDLRPLGQLENLEDINLSYTAVQSLAPLTQLSNIAQLTLYRSYAHDGSQEHFLALEKSVLRLNNGTAYKQNYKPGLQYRSLIGYQRFMQKWTMGGPPRLNPSA